jgi:CheY-like chemotaxis protein
LIFMDCRMPRVDGLEATRRIRAEEGSSRHTPIIALTADVMSEELRVGPRRGRIGYPPYSIVATPGRRLLWASEGSGQCIRDRPAPEI